LKFGQDTVGGACAEKETFRGEQEDEEPYTLETELGCACRQKGGIAGHGWDEKKQTADAVKRRRGSWPSTTRMPSASSKNGKSRRGFEPWETGFAARSRTHAG